MVAIVWCVEEGRERERRNSLTKPTIQTLTKQNKTKGDETNFITTPLFSFSSSSSSSSETIGQTKQKMSSQKNSYTGNDMTSTASTTTKAPTAEAVAAAAAVFDLESAKQSLVQSTQALQVELKKSTQLLQQQPLEHPDSTISSEEWLEHIPAENHMKACGYYSTSSSKSSNNNSSHDDLLEEWFQAEEKASLLSKCAALCFCTNLGLVVLSNPVVVDDEIVGLKGDSLFNLKDNFVSIPLASLNSFVVADKPMNTTHIPTAVASLIVDAGKATKKPRLLIEEDSKNKYGAGGSTASFVKLPIVLPLAFHHGFADAANCQRDSSNNISSYSQYWRENIGKLCRRYQGDSLHTKKKIALDLLSTKEEHDYLCSSIYIVLSQKSLLQQGSASWSTLVCNNLEQARTNNVRTFLVASNESIPADAKSTFATTTTATEPTSPIQIKRLVTLEAKPKAAAPKTMVPSCPPPVEATLAKTMFLENRPSPDRSCVPMPPLESAVAELHSVDTITSSEGENYTTTENESWLFSEEAELVFQNPIEPQDEVATYDGSKKVPTTRTRELKTCKSSTVKGGSTIFSKETDFVFSNSNVPQEDGGAISCGGKTPFASGTLEYKIHEAMAKCYAVGIENPLKILISMECGYKNPTSNTFSKAFRTVADTAILLTLAGQRTALTKYGVESMPAVTVPRTNDEAHSMFKKLAMLLMKTKSAQKLDIVWEKLADGRVHSKEALGMAAGYTNVTSFGIKEIFNVLKKIEVVYDRPNKALQFKEFILEA